MKYKVFSCENVQLYGMYRGMAIVSPYYIYLYIWRIHVDVHCTCTCIFRPDVYVVLLCVHVQSCTCMCVLVHGTWFVCCIIHVHACMYVALIDTCTCRILFTPLPPPIIMSSLPVLNQEVGPPGVGVVNESH